MIQATGFVNQDRPLQSGITDIAFHKRTALERHNGDAHIEPAKSIFLLPQLRQMLTAGQSSQMAVEHQQQPMAREIILGASPAPLVP